MDRQTRIALEMIRAQALLGCAAVVQAGNIAAIYAAEESAGDALDAAFHMAHALVPSASVELGSAAADGHEAIRKARRSAINAMQVAA